MGKRMDRLPEDIFTEPEDVDPDTLANLGPLAPMAGVWEGTKGLDINPGPGPKRQVFIEHMELQPIDPQTNGPQLLYGLHYVTRIVKPDAPETYHHQTGHWLWDAANETVFQTLSIPRVQAALASGRTTKDAKQFELTAMRGSTEAGIVSGPFLEYAFRTDSYRITVTLHDDGRWSYDEATVLTIKGQAEPFLHKDRNTLTRTAPPTPNPLMR
jgi:hypothetical protein